MLLEHRMEMLERDFDKLEKRIANLENISTKNVGTIEYDKEDDKKKDLELQVTLLLRSLGVSAGLLGYKYLKTAIIISSEDNTYLRSIKGKLYSKVAKIYETSPIRVERNIRHALEKCWQTGNIELLNKLFGNSISPNSGKATNGQFIATLVEEIDLKLKNPH